MHASGSLVRYNSVGNSEYDWSVPRLSSCTGDLVKLLFSVLVSGYTCKASDFVVFWLAGNDLCSSGLALGAER